MNLANIINHQDGDRIAFIDGDVAPTYSELRNRVDAVRARLDGAGLGVGDPLAILAGNEVDFAVTALAGLGLGARVVPIRPGSPLPELERKLASVRPKLMVLCVLFLIGAGVIEGYVSPNPDFSLAQRLSIGIGYWLLFVFALCGWRLPKFGPVS